MGGEAHAVQGVRQLVANARHDDITTIDNGVAGEVLGVVFVDQHQFVAVDRFQQRDRFRCEGRGRHHRPAVAQRTEAGVEMVVLLCRELEHYGVLAKEGGDAIGARLGGTGTVAGPE